MEWSILITIYVVLGIVQVAREFCKPYGGSFWFFMFLLGPYILITDFLYEYKEARKLEKR